MVNRIEFFQQELNEEKEGGLQITARPWLGLSQTASFGLSGLVNDPDFFIVTV